MLIPEVYLEPYQGFKKEISAKIVNGFQLLTIFAKSTFLDVRPDSDKSFVYPVRKYQFLKSEIKALQ